MFRIQNVVWRYLKIRKKLHVVQISRCEPEIRIFLVIDQENFPVQTESGKSLRKGLRLVTFQSESLDNIELILFEFLRQSGFQGRTKHLLRQWSVVAARAGAKHRAAFTPQRIPDLSDARAARSLLAPGFLAAARDFRACFCMVRSRS